MQAVPQSTTRLHDPFEHWLAADPDRALIHMPDRDISYRDVGVMVDAVEAELRCLGLGAGDRVLIVAENCPEHLALLLACSRVGAWSCGVNARSAPGELTGFLELCDARIAYFTSGVSRHAAEHGQRHHAQPSALPGLTRSALRPQAQPETSSLRDRVAAIIFTSGTTGRSKGVLMTHEGVMHFAKVSAASRHLGPHDRSYAYLPMTHIFGLGTVLASSLHAGSSLVMRAQFDPADALQALHTGGVSQFQGPPALFSRLLQHLDQIGISHPPCPTLRYLYTGAGPLDLALKRRVEHAFGQPLHHGYGLSEYAGSVAVSRYHQQRDDTAAGFQVKGAQIRVVDPTTGIDCPQGQRGELWLRGTGLTPGYYRDPQATAAVMREGGWYASGDLGEFGTDGAVHVVGRLKEMIIRSGFNVYPTEVEAAINLFPTVQRSAVVGIPEPDGNEQVWAFIELRPGMTLDEPALRQVLREQLAPYKHPSVIRVIGQLPMTTSGKMLKRVLRDNVIAAGSPRA